MNKNTLCLILFTLASIYVPAQTTRIVLIEDFTFTSCTPCAEYDSAFQAVMHLNKEKIASISYHVFGGIDSFYRYCTAGDDRYLYYDMEGTPGAAMNGFPPYQLPYQLPHHIHFVTQERIDEMYYQNAKFNIEITTSPSFTKAETVDISVSATALINDTASDLRLFIAVTEDSINYFERYGAHATNGIEDFYHVMRAMLPTSAGVWIGPQTAGKVNTVSASFTTNDKEIVARRVRVVAFVQNLTSEEVLGAAETDKSPFKEVSTDVAPVNTVKFQLFPTVVSQNDLTIICPRGQEIKSGHIQIVDMLGRSMFERDFSKMGLNANQLKLDVSDFTAGVYFVNIFSAKGDLMEGLKFFVSN